jgi:hypothetical protein
VEEAFRFGLVRFGEISFSGFGDVFSAPFSAASKRSWASFGEYDSSSVFAGLAKF